MNWRPAAQGQQPPSEQANSSHERGKRPWTACSAILRDAEANVTSPKERAGLTETLSCFSRACEWHTCNTRNPVRAITKVIKPHKCRQDNAIQAARKRGTRYPDDPAPLRQRTVSNPRLQIIAS